MITIVLCQIAHWQEQGIQGECSANISADHLLAAGFVDQLRVALQQYLQVQPQHLELPNTSHKLRLVLEALAREVQVSPPLLVDEG